MMQQRDRACGLHNIDYYKQLRKNVIRDVKVASKYYYPSKLQHLTQANTGKWHNKLNELTGKKRQFSSLSFAPNLSLEKATEQINTHFATICQKLLFLEHSNLPGYTD